MRAVLRRTRGDAGAESAALQFADLELDEDTHEVWRAARPVDLTPTEYKLLRYLMLNPRRVLSKAQILDHVWEYDFDGDANVVETYISYLRKKIDPLGPPLIHTVRGVGYSLRPPALTAEAPSVAARPAAWPASLAADGRRAGRQRRWRPTAAAPTSCVDRVDQQLADSRCARRRRARLRGSVRPPARRRAGPVIPDRHVRRAAPTARPASAPQYRPRRRDADRPTCPMPPDDGDESLHRPTEDGGRSATGCSPPPASDGTTLFVAIPPPTSTRRCAGSSSSSWSSPSAVLALPRPCCRCGSCASGCGRSTA